MVLAKSMHRADLDAALASDAPALPLSHLTDVEPHEPRTRSNDGRADRHGNFVFGTMDESAQKAPIGTFYQYSAAHGLRRLPLPGAAIPNSICFSPDGRTLYWCDSVQPTILCCDYEPEAAFVGPSRVFADIELDGAAADGSTIDAEGGLWNAQWGGARVVRYAPDGRRDRIVPMPVPQPSCCAIGGAHLDTLYVITSPQGLDASSRAAAPESGSLFEVPRERPGPAREPRGAALIAVDWGGSSLRAYRLDGGGSVVDVRRSNNGALVCAGRFGEVLSALIAGWDDPLVVMAGMIGARGGWVEVPYVQAPADASALAAGMIRLDTSRETPDLSKARARSGAYRAWPTGPHPLAT